MCIGLIKGKNKAQGSNEATKKKKKRKIKKAYVLEVIKRDSVEPAEDLIYTGGKPLVGVNNVLIFKEIFFFSLSLSLLSTIKKKKKKKSPSGQV